MDKTSIDHVKKYPISTQWITFPIDIRRAYEIRWVQDSNRERKATYYHSKCYWGYLDESKLSPEKLAQTTGPIATSQHLTRLVGETWIFIAAEFVESHYLGGPLDQFHVKSLALTDVKINQASNANAVEQEEPRWISMKLNDWFEYGQESNKWLRSAGKRWIVYHPPVITGCLTPKMFQHRFMEALMRHGQGQKGEPDLEVEESFGDPQSTAIKGGLQAVSIVLEEGKKQLLKKAGDYLHEFLSPEAVKKAMDHMDRKFDENTRLKGLWIWENKMARETDIREQDRYLKEVLLAIDADARQKKQHAADALAASNNATGPHGNEKAIQEPMQISSIAPNILPQSPSNDIRVENILDQSNAGANLGPVPLSSRKTINDGKGIQSNRLSSSKSNDLISYNKQLVSQRNSPLAGSTNIGSRTETSQNQPNGHLVHPNPQNQQFAARSNLINQNRKLKPSGQPLSL